MAFESLSERLGKASRNITEKRKLSEKNINDMLHKVRTPLPGANVNYGIVKDSIAHVKEQALGTEVMASLNPGQMVVKIVRDEIAVLLGNEDAPVDCKSSGMTTVMTMGLQGTDKTMASARIANVMKKKWGHEPSLIACDVIHPVTTEQLKTLGGSIGVGVFSLGVETKALETAKQAMGYAKENSYDTVSFDTVGRLHIDEELMQELSDIKAFVRLDDTLLTVDVVAGQDIVNVAGSFRGQLGVTGLVLTKLDGDSRGGGILSVHSITQVPVKFVGLGEKIDDLDAFHPNRIADRILSVGDIMSPVGQAQDKIDIEANTKSANRMMNGQFTLTDMLVQFQQLERVGSLGGMMKLIPGMSQLAGQIDEVKAGSRMKRSTAIIQSMTMEEREGPDILRTSKESRIAKGSGTMIADVNRLLDEYEKTKQVMKRMSAMTKSSKMPSTDGMGAMGAMKNMRSMSKMMHQGGKRGRR